VNSAHKILTKQEERILFSRVRKGCTISRDELVENNYRLVLSIAGKYAHNSHHMDDLVQEGFIGLMIAIDKFNSISNNKFSTYAVYWIKQRIIRFIEGDSTIREPSWVHSKRSKLNSLSEHSEEEAAKILNISLKTVKSVRKTIFIDQSKSGYENANMIPDKHPNSEEILLNKEDIELVIELLKGLNTVEKEIIIRRYGIGCEKETFAIIGKHFGVTRERIRQIQLQAENKMRRKAEIRGLEWTSRY
jgi:RNA polymerase sigma factor (sigma-70 family)